MAKTTAKNSNAYITYTNGNASINTSSINSITVNSSAKLSNTLGNIISTAPYTSYTIDTCDYGSMFDVNAKSLLSKIFDRVHFEEYQIRALLASPQTAEIVDLNRVLETHKMSEMFLEEMLDKLDVTTICRTQKLSAPFIDKHYDKLKEAMSMLCLEQHLKKTFIKQHKDEMRWDSIARNSSISFTYEFIVDNITYFDQADALQYLSSNSKISNDIMNKLIENLDICYLDKLNWQEISFKYTLTEDNIKNNIDRLYFEAPSLRLRHYEDVSIPLFMHIKYGIKIDEYLE